MSELQAIMFYILYIHSSDLKLSISTRFFFDILFIEFNEFEKELCSIYRNQKLDERFISSYLYQKIYCPFLLVETETVCTIQ